MSSLSPKQRPEGTELETARRKARAPRGSRDSQKIPENQEIPGILQARLKLGPADDRYEQEADSVARAVMQREQQPVQKDKDGESVRRQETPEEDEEGAIQEKMDDGALQRQPEEEDELQPKTENGWAQRQVEEEEEEPAV